MLPRRRPRPPVGVEVAAVERSERRRAEPAGFGLKAGSGTSNGLVVGAEPLRYQGRFPAASRAVGGSIRRVSGPCASSLSAKSSRSCVSIISRRSVPTS